MCKVTMKIDNASDIVPERQLNINKNIKKLLLNLEDRLIERETLSRLIVLAIFAKSNMFLIGDRGVAKSHAIRLVNGVFKDSKELWQIQGSASTESKNLYGKEYINKDNQICLNMKGTLLDTNIGFIDEMFKIPGKVLNGILELLVDRYFTFGDGKRYKTELNNVFAASNEYPTEKEMEAYVDRFLIWIKVERIEKIENRIRFYTGSYNKMDIDSKYFKLSDLEYIQEEAQNIEFPKQLVTLYTDITNILIKSGVKTSDRKYGEIIKLFKISAFLNCRKNINYSELFLLSHTAWHNDTEKDKVDKHLSDIIFGSKIEIEDELMNIQSKYEIQRQYEKGELFDVLSFKMQFKGDKALELFLLTLKEINQVLDNYRYLMSCCDKLIEVKNGCDFVIKQCEDNIFLNDIKCDTFDDELITKIFLTKKDIGDRIYFLSNWLQGNNELYLYNKAKVFD